MFKLVLKKMINNIWLVFCLLIGCILITAIISSVPMYSDGILQRMLTKDIEIFQREEGVFPGNYVIEINKSLKKEYNKCDDWINNKILPQVDLPIVVSNKELCIDSLNFVPEKRREKRERSRYVYINSISDLNSHINIDKGHKFSNEIKDGVIEAVVTYELLNKFDMRLNETYKLNDLRDKPFPYKVKIVGVVEMKDINDPYWFDSISSYNENVFIDENILYDLFMEKGKGEQFYKGKWNTAFDYHKITTENFNRIVNVFKSHEKWGENNKGFSIKIVAQNVLNEYNARQKQLLLTLLIIMIPVIFVMLYYIFMTSQLIIKNEQNEIAVLKSRGSTRNQIVKIYFIESLILCIISIIIGPIIGIFLCKLIGASNGFLSFVDRTALEVKINFKTYLYSGVGLIIIMITMMIPSYKYSKTTIVHHKQQKKRNKSAMWKKCYLDIILLGISIYGLYNYKSQSNILKFVGDNNSQLQIDPLIFLSSTVFILGAGLLLIRIFPLVVKFIFFIGKKIWSPSVYMSFLQISRSKGEEQFIMLFLIIVMAVGIFSANAARTINKNIEDHVKYQNGTDIILKEKWVDSNYYNQVSNDLSFMSIAQSGNTGSSSYIEPPFSKFTEMDGVENATKVYVSKKSDVQIKSESLNNINVMGIIPHEFGKISWFRNDLLPYHINQYLNVMTENNECFLVSSNLKNKYKDLEVGDDISIKIGNDFIDGIICGFLDYWPTFNPNLYKNENYLVVGNLKHFQDNSPIQPYEVWIKKKANVYDETIYDQMDIDNFKILKINSCNQEIIKQKNDPMLQGINGALTLVFINTMLVSLIGFLIYWILSIQSRTLRFGVLRALGLSFFKVLRSIIYEQIIISGTALIGGIVIGGIASDYFVPLFQVVFTANEQVPPFKVISSADDYIKIYILMIIMLVIGLSVLAKIISRINIGQALKLGED